MASTRTTFRRAGRARRIRTGAPGPGVDFSGFDFSNFGGEEKGGGVGSAFRDLFSQIFSRGGAEEPPAEGPERGADLEHRLHLGFWDAIRGTTVRLTVARAEACASCHGTGSAGGAAMTCPACGGSGKSSRQAGVMRFSVACPECGGSGKRKRRCATCGGSGQTRRPESFEVRIPPGVDSGSRVRVPGKGNASVAGAAYGDLYIVTDVEPHPYFERKGDNIYVKLPVTRHGSGARSQGGSADHRRAHYHQDSTRHADRPEAALAREGRTVTARQRAR